MTERLTTKLPVIHLEGTPYEQGHTYGSIAWKRIEQNIKLYFKRFQEECGLSEAEVLERASAYWGAIKRTSQTYADALRGMAIGTGYELMHLVALNVRYEIIYHEYVVHSYSDGCSAIAVSSDRSANGHLLMGENWDWIPGVHGALLHTRSHGFETLSFSEAGIFGGKIGFNSQGLGLMINGLNSTIDDWSRLEKPFHAMCYEILQSRSIMDAVDVVTEGTRLCSANFLLAQTDNFITDIETAPLSTRVLRPQQGILAHTNHFIEPAALGISEPDNDTRDYSAARLQRIHDLAGRQERISLHNLAEIMRDHKDEPYALCRHSDPDLDPSDHYQTVVSVLIDLHDQSMWVANGLPCEEDYVHYTLQRAAVRN